MDSVSNRIKIRIIAMGFPNLKAFADDYMGNGGKRNYHWWRTLTGDSSYNDLVEAADALGLDVPVILGGDQSTDSSLIREGVDEGFKRVKLHG